jgi:hypothetical protein
MFTPNNLVGYSEAYILSIILALAVKTISHYSNHVFDTPVNSAFTGRVWAGATTAID